MVRVKRSTTIVYPKDLGMIISELGINTGQKIVEIGTGSGALTFTLANILGEKGFIDSIDIDSRKQEIGKENFRNYCKFKNVKWHTINIAEEKLPITSSDAIFIDISEPWNLIKKIRYLLKDGHAIGILCPSFEQVKCTANALNKSGFTRIRCHELIERKIFLRENSTRPADYINGHTAFYLFAEKIADEYIDEVLNFNIRQTWEI